MNIITDLKEFFDKQVFLKMVISNPRSKATMIKKIEIKPVMIKHEYLIQFETIENNSASHENLDTESALQKIEHLILNEYRSFFLRTSFMEYDGLVSKKGRITVSSKSIEQETIEWAHDRKKEYIFPEKKPIDFLIKLGIMNEEGIVYKKKYNKFRQINKFLEIIQDTMQDISEDRIFRIVDFGCGKAYLTFAVYHYFVAILHKEVEIIGLDLKEDVIDFCNQIASELQYSKLKFMKGSIESFDDWHEVDMMITLHACDMATDAALVKAVNWGTKYILSVPCCQHEFFSKIHNVALTPMLNHGLIKERLSSLVTDTVRTLYLNKEGYDVKVIEFVSLEHTPKNIMITARKTGRKSDKDFEAYESFKSFWNLEDLYIDRF
ncbi:MAG: SAM-dependent methyltransferase [Tissierellales bacterium]|nr:SAM-dependent methyltransferase [Tissierellales bacterium]MBN2826373.1 SAM-dependent methyltransferase [Tissierellales bacterium]